MYAFFKNIGLNFITIRIASAMFFSFIFVYFAMPRYILLLKKYRKNGQPIRKEYLENHAIKEGTPTMGGLLMCVAVIVSTVLFCNLKQSAILLLIGLMTIFCIIGVCDDWKKISQKSHKGVSGKVRFAIEFVVGSVFILIAMNCCKVNGNIYFPIFKNIVINAGLLYVIFGALVINGSANAVNLTDGLDGLVSMPLFLTTLTMCLVSYFAGDVQYAKYLHVNHIPAGSEISVMCGAVMGVMLGFLWFNAKPASIFMGDSGSLPFGAFLGGVAVLIQHEILLFFAGMIFVIEAMSVILQVGSYKLRKKRIFLIAPLHHHFEKKGLSEEKIVIRFWLISFLFTVIALGLVKIK